MAATDKIINAQWESAGVYPPVSERGFVIQEKPTANKMNSIAFGSSQNAVLMAEYLDKNALGRYFFPDDMIVKTGTDTGYQPDMVSLDKGWETFRFDVSFANPNAIVDPVQEVFFQYPAADNELKVFIEWTVLGVSTAQMVWGLEYLGVVPDGNILAAGANQVQVVTHSGVANGRNLDEFTIASATPNAMYRFRLYRDIGSSDDAKAYQALLLGVRVR